MLKQFTLLQSAPLLPPTFTARSRLFLTRKPATSSSGLLALLTTHPLATYDLDLPTLFLGFAEGLRITSTSEEAPLGLRAAITRLGRTPDGRGLAVMRSDGSETWSVPRGATRLVPSDRRSDENDLVVFENGTAPSQLPYYAHCSRY